MERRREPRIKTSEAAQVTLLGDSYASFPARTLDASGKGMRISLSRPVKPGSAVKVELEDSILLAEISYCVPAAEGYTAGLQVDQILTGLKELTRLNARLLADSRGPVLSGPNSREDQETASRSQQHGQIAERIGVLL